MYAVSLWQPWASLMAHEHKRIETRSWRWPHHLPSVVAIHAAQKWTLDLARMCRWESVFYEALRSAGIQPHDVNRQRLQQPTNMPFGAVVAVGRLAACVPITAKPVTGERTIARDEDGIVRDWHPGYPDNQWRVQHVGIGDEFGDHEAAFGDYRPGRWGWIFDRMHRLPEPIPAKGNRMVWQWEPPAELRIEDVV